MSYEISAREARTKMASLLENAKWKGERVIICRHGEPMGVLIPIKDLKKLEEMEMEQGMKDVEDVY